MNDWIVRKADFKDVKEVVAYILKCREELYPMLSKNNTPHDVADFEDVYLHGNGAFLLLVTNKNNDIIGTVGLIPYDNRFISFDYSNYKTAEIVRMYVDVKYRNNGIGTHLINCLISEAKKLAYEVLYLHTHPFLDNAIEFWKQRGFEITAVDNSHIIQTIHMKKNIK